VQRRYRSVRGSDQGGHHRPDQGGADRTPERRVGCGASPHHRGNGGRETEGGAAGGDPFAAAWSRGLLRKPCRWPSPSNGGNHGRQVTKVETARPEAEGRCQGTQRGRGEV